MLPSTNGEVASARIPSRRPCAQVASASVSGRLAKLNARLFARFARLGPTTTRISGRSHRLRMCERSSLRVPWSGVNNGTVPRSIAPARPLSATDASLPSHGRLSGRSSSVGRLPSRRCDVPSRLDTRQVNSAPRMLLSSGESLLQSRGPFGHARGMDASTRLLIASLCGDLDVAGGSAGFGNW